MAGITGRSGRRKSPTKQITDALNELRSDVPTLIASLKVLAFGKPIVCPHCGKEGSVNRVDRESATYLLDRILLKQRHTQDLNLNVTPVLSREQIIHIANTVRELDREPILIDAVPNELNQGSSAT